MVNCHFSHCFFGLAMIVAEIVFCTGDKRWWAFWDLPRLSGVCDHVVSGILEIIKPGVVVGVAAIASGLVFYFFVQGQCLGEICIEVFGGKVK